MVSRGSLPASRSRMNGPPKTFSFQRAYMRCLISSVKAFASLGESLFPISSTKGVVVITLRARLQTLPWRLYARLIDLYFSSRQDAKNARNTSFHEKTALKSGTGFRYALFQLSPVFVGKRRAFPAWKAFDRQTAHTHQFAE